MIPALLFFVTFIVVASWAQTAGGEIHVNDVFPALSFLAAVVVAVLGFLLKWLITRDRASVDTRIDDLHKHVDNKAAESKSYIDGLGIKVERLADTIEENISKAVVELRRHDEDIFTQLRQMNRELGVLQGEHETLKGQHIGRGKHLIPACREDRDMGGP